MPGFQFRIQDLYTKPVPPQMVQDPIYNTFISPFYQNERLRAERAETQVEGYAQMLRAAGLLPLHPSK